MKLWLHHINFVSEDVDRLRRFYSDVMGLGPQEDDLPVREATRDYAGDVAFLKHKETGVVRLLMRREKTKKICANFTLGTGDKAIQLKPNSGSDRSWCWSCQDFSEEKADTMSILAIRFANSENALEFKKEWLKATGATDSAADAPRSGLGDDG